MKDSPCWLIYYIQYHCHNRWFRLSLRVICIVQDFELRFKMLVADTYKPRGGGRKIMLPISYLYQRLIVSLTVVLTANQRTRVRMHKHLSFLYAAMILLASNRRYVSLQVSKH